ncbi:hypothetical protein [Actinomycetospora sp.]|uniref:hypothetical protein n=1 Tax=Actinomycetospora sp. TaxID=1872135 RepID=UPI002F408EB3
MLTDQAAALARAEELVDVELWRADRRAAALTVLRGLVHGMNWETGLVAGVTRAHLAAGAGCSVRTVSRVVAWAVEAGLLVCIETGATAEFLGTDTNRAPSYVLTAPVGALAVEQSGNPPACGGERSSPRRERGLKEGHDEQGGGSSWPVYDRATTTEARARAVQTLLERTGLAGRVVRWRAVAMLGPWFAEGWCVAGLLHALDHHPDQPGASRGDAARAARDPLRVIGHRLSPWRGRLGDLPAGLAAVDGHARRTRAATLAEMATGTDTAATATAGRSWPGLSGRPRAAAETRATARAEISRVLSRPRANRAAMGGYSRTLGSKPVVVDH